MGFSCWWCGGTAGWAPHKRPSLSGVCMCCMKNMSGNMNLKWAWLQSAITLIFIFFAIQGVRFLSVDVFWIQPLFVLPLLASWLWNKQDSLKRVDLSFGIKTIYLLFFFFTRNEVQYLRWRNTRSSHNYITTSVFFTLQHKLTKRFRFDFTCQTRAHGTFFSLWSCLNIQK